MLENGILVKHKRDSYKGRLDGITRIPQCFTGNTNCEFQYRIKLSSGDIKIAPEEDLEVVSAVPLIQESGTRFNRLAPFFKEYIEKYQLYYLMHFTHRNNIRNILRGGLVSKNELERTSADYCSIADEEVQELREHVILHLSKYAEKKLHECVPLYMSWKTPTLYKILNNKNIAHSDIIHICVNTSGLLRKDKYHFCFTDGNAASRITKQYVVIQNLDKLDWNVIKSTHWGGDDERVRKKNAEFLVYPNIDPEDFYKLIVYDDESRKEITVLVSESHINIPVEVNKKYYEWS